MKKIVFVFFVSFIFLNTDSIWAEEPSCLERAMTQAEGKSVKQINSEGFELYKQGKYEDALIYFKKSFEADEAYYRAHYNYACTVSILYARDVCGYQEDLESVFTHLEKTVQLKPEYKTKMRKDPDLKPLRQFYRFYMIAGYDVKEEKDLFEVLTSISWYGPKPGVYPANPVFKFNTDHSVKIGALTVSPDGMMGSEYEYQTGRYTLEGNKIRITLEKKTGNMNEIKARFEDGKIIFKDNAFNTLSDEQGLCGA